MMTLHELIEQLSHVSDTSGGDIEVVLTVEDDNDLGEFIDSPARGVYVQAGHVFISGVDDV